MDTNNPAVELIDREIEELKRTVATAQGRIAALEKSRATLLGEEPPTTRLSIEERQRITRDWIVSQGDADITVASAAEAMDVSEAYARRLLYWAEERGIATLVQAGAQAPGAKAIWRYAKKEARVTSRAEHTRRHGGAMASVAGRGGGGPVAATVKHPDKDVERAIAAARAAGAMLERLGSGHYKLSMPGKQALTLHGTASDHRALKNFKAQMRRNGYPV